ncbi:pre-rRNA-processing protein esf1 [Actinomortierella wolfii]|nr:pre-rRNA-processing protein esf1 [Actinomortierella wolfii]
MVDKKNKKKGGAGGKPAVAPVTDPRFAHVHRDPRFRRPQTKESKVAIDSRFSSMLKSKEFSSAPKVDKYGRKLKSNASDAQMKRFYELQKGGASDDEDEDEDESSTSDDDDDEDKEEEEEEEEEEEKSEASEAESDEEGDDEENVYDPMRGMGTLAGDSSDESDSDMDEDAMAKLDAEAEEEEEEEAEDIPRGEETHRFACVNMDWDHIKAVDLFKVFSGFKPERGAIRSVKIYPSEFGKERIEREEREGPPPEIFKKPTKDDSDDDEEVTKEKLIQEQTDEGKEEFDADALRKYQLERLKYYYAVVDTDSVATAKAICEACDGAEYESSANFFDLRYIPDGMEFDDTPKDECYHAPEQYKPNDFTTQVFQHSNVKLTWDEDDADRIRVTRHKFSKQDLEDMDFKAYLASSDEEDSDEEEDIETTRRKYRALLAASNNNDSDDEDEDGDGKRDKDQEMEITFAPGLSEAASRLLEEKKEREAAERQARGEETSIEAYKRKEKERKKRRKEARKARLSGKESGDGSAGEDEEMAGGDLFSSDEDERLMNDAYFAEEFAGGDMMMPGKKNKKDGKQENKNKKNKKKTKEERLEEQRRKAELELLMEDNRESNQHFNMKEIMKAEKKKKNKKQKGGKEGEDLQDDFKIDVNDPRFAALHESHEFALDPTNPQFKKTKAMTELIKERQKRSSKMQEETANNLKKKQQQKQQQQQQQKNKNSNNSNKKPATQGPFQDPSLSLLVDTVKRKSAMATDSTRDGKRAKTK